MAQSHLRRHSQLQSLRSQALVELSDCCCLRSLPRLGELVDQLLFERQVAQPPLPLDPEILELLPYSAHGGGLRPLFFIWRLDFGRDWGKR
jgi:hypothetical protein